MTEKIPLNRAWDFAEEASEPFLRGEGPAPSVVDLPHTCRQTPYNYFDESVYQMVCAYRRRLPVPESWAGKRVFLKIGAAAHSAEVYCNGQLLGEHHCGYTAFTVELTGALIPGQDAVLAVRVDSRESQDIPPFGRVVDYMTYGGLYREVWLEVREQSYLEDVFVRPFIPAEEGYLRGTESGEEIAALRFTGVVHSTVTLVPDRATVLRQRVYASGEAEHLAERLYPLDGSPTLEGKLLVPEAGLWDIDSPRLYVLKTELMAGDLVLDETETRFGFRRAVFRPEGFYLNGRKLKLRGLNRHQSYPYVGYAMPRSMQRLDAEILRRELGCNAVRTSHYPQSQHFVDRCDELGLLVFTEIPGWQHMGGEAWQDQAVRNTEDMVLQYRNHPSVILWGVRINESRDNDPLYERTNAAARRLDPTRQTGGVRCHKNSHLLEDVYTYNDFVHEGDNKGCESKGDVTGQENVPYLVTEYAGHMYPTKSYDCEEHRLSHALRHAKVLDAVAAEEDIAGSFGWCLFDYNTHRDFGSGDRICYHGVTDMFRNAKLAAAVYAAQQEETPVLAVSSSMDIGEHPAGNRGRTFLFTNAESVRMYKNGAFIREYTPQGSAYPHLAHPPIEIDDYLGDQIEKGESFTPRQAAYVKDLINESARFGASHLSREAKAKAAYLMLRHGMTFEDAYELYGKYVGDWGAEATVYRFDAVKDGRVVKSVTRGPVTEIRLHAEADHRELREAETYDAALIRLTMCDQDGNVLPFYQGYVRVEIDGPAAILGPDIAMLRGGMGGVYLRTIGKEGTIRVTLRPEDAPEVHMDFTVTREGGV